MLESGGLVKAVFVNFTVPTVTWHVSFLSSFSAAFGVGSGCVVLVAVGESFAGFAGMAAIDLVAMRPAVVGVWYERAAAGVVGPSATVVVSFGGQFDFDTGKVGMGDVELGNGLCEFLGKIAVGGG